MSEYNREITITFRFKSMLDIDQDLMKIQQEVKYGFIFETNPRHIDNKITPPQISNIAIKELEAPKAEVPEKHE